MALGGPKKEKWVKKKKRSIWVTKYPLNFFQLITIKKGQIIAFLVCEKCCRAGREKRKIFKILIVEVNFLPKIKQVFLLG